MDKVKQGFVKELMTEIPHGMSKIPYGMIVIPYGMTGIRYGMIKIPYEMTGITVRITGVSQGIDTDSCRNNNSLIRKLLMKLKIREKHLTTFFTLIATFSRDAGVFDVPLHCKRVNTHHHLLSHYHGITLTGYN